MGRKPKKLETQLPLATGPTQVMNPEDTGRMALRPQPAVRLARTCELQWTRSEPPPQRKAPDSRLPERVS